MKPIIYEISTVFTVLVISIAGMIFTYLWMQTEFLSFEFILYSIMVSACIGSLLILTIINDMENKKKEKETK